ncbi:MAG TPA: sulfatase-like hydrolase/transferase [Longimicrobiales bacterium]|nr:sulfatase-like hydrolase/transferase [Longimicrobiales bacterium]
MQHGRFRCEHVVYDRRERHPARVQLLGRPHDQSRSAGDQHGAGPDDRQQRSGPSFFRLVRDPHPQACIGCERADARLARRSRKQTVLCSGELFRCARPVPAGARIRAAVRANPSDGRNELPSAPHEPHDAERQHARGAEGTAGHDGSIAWLDDELGKLFDELDARGHLENTIVIVTSDHGEAFEEHGRLGHGGDLHMELIRVPLVISFPDRLPAGRRVADPVTLADLPATILDLLDVGEHNMPGQSLATAWDQVHPAVPDSPILAWDGSEAERGAILLDGWQYIRGVGGKDELYHIAADTLQLRNLIDDTLAAGTLAMMRAALDSAAAISPRERVRSGRAAQPDQRMGLQPSEPPQRRLRPVMD